MDKHIDIAVYLTELQTALNDIEDFTRDQTQNLFVKNKLCHKAVTKSFEQISEASNKIKNSS